VQIIQPSLSKLIYSKIRNFSDIAKGIFWGGIMCKNIEAIRLDFVTKYIENLGSGNVETYNKDPKDFIEELLTEGDTTIIYAPENNGKTIFSICLAYSFAYGYNLFSSNDNFKNTAQRKKTLYIDLENSIKDLCNTFPEKVSTLLRKGINTDSDGEFYYINFRNIEDSNDYLEYKKSYPNEMLSTINFLNTIIDKINPEVLFIDVFTNLNEETQQSTNELKTWISNLKLRRSLFLIFQTNKDNTTINGSNKLITPFRNRIRVEAVRLSEEQYQYTFQIEKTKNRKFQNYKFEYELDNTDSKSIMILKNEHLEEIDNHRRQEYVELARNIQTKINKDNLESTHKNLCKICSELKSVKFDSAKITIKRLADLGIITKPNGKFKHYQFNLD